MAFLLFLTAFVLSGIAAYYSVIGLIAIFSAATLPVAIMGGSLEAAKLVVASWLYRYWKSIPFLMKAYFTSALVILMIITSMGIFGFLSKAHSDQSLVGGDVQAKIAVYDEKIKTAKENIDANRKALRQMDEAVDQVMGRSTDEKGADKAVALRRAQQKERGRLIAEIETYQKTISSLNEERSPIAAEVRKVEAEVGPLKYIAAMIYGDNPDENSLERSVRWLIILLIAVFDPLAVLMLIAANLTQIKSKEWKKQAEEVKPDVEQTKIIPNETELPLVAETAKPEETQSVNAPLPEPSVQPNPPVETVGEPVSVDPHPIGWMYSTLAESAKTTKKKRAPAKKVVAKKTPAKKVVAKKVVAKKTPAKKVVVKKVSSKKKAVTPEPIVSPNSLDLDASIERPGDYLTITPPIDQNVEDKSIVQGFIPQPIIEENQIQTMIDNNDTNGLEEAYKRIVKELGKKNRSKSTHWGPIKNNKK
jgi:hypothetical protein